MLDLLRDAALRRLFVVQTVNSFGNALTFWALAWLLLRAAPDSPGLAGSALAVLSGAVLVGHLGLGPHLDRWDRRRILVGGNAALALVTALLPAAAAVPPALLALVALSGLLGSVTFAAWQASLPLLAPPGRHAAVQALFGTSAMASGLLAPAVAGLLIGWLGPAIVLWIDAGTYLFAAVGLAGWRVPAAPRADPGTEGGGPAPDARLLAGWRFVLARRALWGAFLALGATNGFHEAFTALLLPRLADRWAAGAFTPALAVGVLDSVSVGFELIGALWWGRRSLSPLAERRALAVGCALTVALALGLVATPLYGLALLLAAVQGLAFSPLGVYVGVIAARGTPPGLLGRVTSVRAFLASGPRPAFTFAAGAALPLLGLAPLAVLLAGASFAILAAGWPRAGNDAPEPKLSAGA